MVSGAQIRQVLARERCSPQRARPGAAADARALAGEEPRPRRAGRRLLRRRRVRAPLSARQAVRIPSYNNDNSSKSVDIRCLIMMKVLKHHRPKCDCIKTEL